MLRSFDLKANSALSERISPTASGLAPDRRRIPENWWGIILMAPAILLIAGLVLYPVLYSMWLSLHAKHAYLPIQRFIGLENFKFFLLEDEEFWRALKLGSIFTFGSLTLQIVIGIGAALVLNETFVGRGFVRAVTLFPYMLPTIVVVILMRWIFNDSYGIAKYLIQSSGLTQTPIVWFSSGMVMITLIMVSTWTFFPFVVIGTLSRLQTIDPELYAAAKVDGAGIFRRFYHITLPQLRSVIFVVVLLRFMFMFTKFDLVWLFAGAGGVGYFVRTLPIYTYLKTFGEMQVGAGAALSTMMFVMLGVFAFAYFTFFRREEHL